MEVMLEGDASAFISANDTKEIEAFLARFLGVDIWGRLLQGHYQRDAQLKVTFHIRQGSTAYCTWQILGDPIRRIDATTEPDLSHERENESIGEV